MQRAAQISGITFAAVLGLAAQGSCDTFDYVIAGAGTAGLVLANRLSEDPSIRVAVIDPGQDGAEQRQRHRSGPFRGCPRHLDRLGVPDHAPGRSRQPLVDDELWKGYWRHEHYQW